MAVRVSAASVIGLIVVGLVAVFTSVTAPLILAHRTEKMHREDREADWARQDRAARLLLEKQDEQAAAAAKAATDLAASQKEVADQAAQAASLLVDAQAETIRRSDQVAELAAERDGQVTKKLDLIDAQAKRIHTLVNSDMTAARQGQLDQTRAMIVQTKTMIAVLTKVVQLAESRGQKPDPEDVRELSAAQEALDSSEERAHDLEQILADRMHQMQKVEAAAAEPGALDLDAAAAAAADDDDDDDDDDKPGQGSGADGDGK
jgi:hypothetical protein